MLIPEYSFDVSDPRFIDVPMAYTPTVPLRLIVEAAFALAKDPDQDISIRPEYLPYISGTLGDIILQDILDQHHRGIARDKFAARFDATLGTTAACATAEGRFLDSLLSRTEATRIIVNESGDPLVFQKNVDKKCIGERLGLTLRDLTIGRITYPSGILVKVKTPHHVTDHAPVTIMPHGQIEALGVLRVSAFAVPPASRDPFLVECDDGGEVADTTMDDIRDSVRRKAQNA